MTNRSVETPRADGARTVVMLGAGASVDAGLPLTSALAASVVSAANTKSSIHAKPAWVKALNFVYGSMIGYQAREGNNPLDAVNIERLISALRLLQEADTHEVAPFVESWHLGALGFGIPKIKPTSGRTLRNAILDERFTSLDGSRIVNPIADIAREAVRRSSPSDFREAEENVLEILVEKLSALDSVDYLTPLAELATSQQHGLDVLTLNYDLAVERMAQDRGVRISRGVEEWQPGVPLIFESRKNQINLIKLHGSLDWALTRPGSHLRAPKIEVREALWAESEDYSSTQRILPWIVVGDREKLGTEGPTLALIRSAEDALSRADHLVVVGYSFGDRHINSLIRDWLLCNEQRTIGVVDIGWESTHITGFRRDLIESYGADRSRQPRVVPIEGRAAHVLRHALYERPAITPEKYVTDKWEWIEKECYKVWLRLEGPGLTSVTFDNAFESQGQFSRPSGVYQSRDEMYSAFGAVEPAKSRSFRFGLSTWQTGDEIEVYVILPSGSALRGLRIWGHRLDCAWPVCIKVGISEDDQRIQ